MSFIDKAIERAKALQSKHKNVPTTPSEGVAPADMSAEKQPITITRPLSSDRITHRNIRTAEVDLEALHRRRLIAGPEQTSVIEEYKLLRTHILQRTKGAGRNILMVSGPMPGEGKTLTAINLAISISQEVNQTVLLVDVDLRAPSIHRYFGLSRGPGLVDHLISGVPIADLLVSLQGFDQLVLLPAGRPSKRGAELINSPLMADLVQELKHYYPDRYVIFDLPPLLSYADALAFAPLVDGIVLVVEAGKTPKEAIVRCLDMLKEFPVLGFVLNKVEGALSYSYYSRKNEALFNDRKRKFPWFK